MMLLSKVHARGLAVRGRTRCFSTAAPAVPVRTKIWKTYCRHLNESPLLTKASLASFIFFMSDSATQMAFEETYSPSRALSGASFGIIATTWLHFWWGFLETTIETRLPVARHRLANTLSKVFIDQSIGAPIYIYFYYVCTNFVERVADSGGTSEEAWSILRETIQKASEMIVPTMQQHYKLWPAVHCVNFYFTPLHHRVLVQNTALVGWSGYLSHLNHRGNGLMTPDEEIRTTIHRKETEKLMAMTKGDRV